MDIDRFAYTFRTYRWLLQSWRLPFVPALRIDRPIFLLGMQGGGLSLLSRILRRHRDAISVAGNAGYWTSSDEIANTFGLILPPEFAGLRFKAPPHPVLTAPRSWTYASQELIEQYRKTAVDATPRLEKRFKQAIRFAALLNARDRLRFRFVDKSQTNTVRLGLLNAVLRDCDPRFVLVTRDPYVSVYRAVNGKAGDIRRLSDRLSYEERVRICVEHYMNSMRAVFEDSESEGIPVHMVRFEDILNDPESSVRAVCDFVDLDFSEDMLPRPEHELPWGSRFKSRWWPLRTDVNAGYADKMEGWVIEEVNKHGRDLVSRLGYEVMDSR